MLLGSAGMLFGGALMSDAGGHPMLSTVMMLVGAGFGTLTLLFNL